MKNLLTALLAAQKKIKGLKKDEHNPYYNKPYLSLNGIREAILPVLNEYNLVVLQPTYEQNGKLFVKTRIIHVDSGEELSSDMPIASHDFSDAQKIGSGISYARRYALLSLLFLSAEDDDGNAATNRANYRLTEEETNGEQKVLNKPTFKKIQPPNKGDSL
ncbi:MAG: ERF family protein [Bacteroidia bacterium]|nr:ERF family protein [Bacteroidia bacterium]